MKTHLLLKLLLIGSLLFWGMTAQAQVQLPAIFSDNMVLQQQSNAPIWGKAKANADVKITTSWDKKEYKTQADTNGKWMIKVATPTAGGPYEISISEKSTIKLKNILIGEVWICSGQSNMEMPLSGWGQVYNYEKEIKEANYPNIRLLQVEKAMSLAPLSDIKVAGGSWQMCSPTTIPGFSSTAYFFGRNIHLNQNIPIGLIHTSWGGTPAEAWVSNDALQMMPDYLETTKEINQIPPDAETRKKVFSQKREEWNNGIIAEDFGYDKNIAIAAQSDYNDSDWSAMPLPGYWESSVLPNFDGFVWFRKTINIPTDWDNKELMLTLGAIDDNEVTYFNGTLVGQTEGYSVNRQYSIPAKLVKRGKAVITVRVTDTGGEGGFKGNMNIALYKNGKASSINLAGDWKYKIAVNMSDIEPFPRLYADNPSNPTSLYNAMIHPIIPYAIKGAIWYQGESNESKAYQYRTLFPLLIHDWRTRWDSDFPFYFVQLANYKKAEPLPSESNWAEVREAQTGALHMINTGMAVTIDIGDADDIHPKNKQDVGNRLALIARAQLYGENISYSGPIYKSHKIEGNRIRITFEHTDKGLKAKGENAVKGFSVAGPDRKFYRADAKIEGNDIIVNSSDVPFPIAVRYGWAINPICNLSNGADLPASPFRTDDWPGVTFKY